MTPKGWSATRLGTAFSKKTQRGRPGLPTLSVTLDNGLVPRETIDRKMETSLEPEEHLLVERGDITYNTMRMWQGASGVAAEDALVSPAYVVLRAQPHIDTLFAAYLFKHPRIVYLFWAYSYGLTEDRLRLYFDDFCLVPVELPPLHEQRRIAEILFTWDRAIETVEMLIANAREQRTALMQALLTGERRLPAGAESPREWIACTLGDLFTFKNGLNGEKALYGSGVKFVNVMDIFRARTLRHKDIAGSMFVTPKQLAEYGVKKGDVLFNRTSEIDDEIAISTVYLDDTPAVFGGFVIRARPRADVLDVGFSVYAFQSPSIRRAMVRLGQGGIRSNIGQGDLATVRLLLPPLAEQAKIATVLASEDRTIETLEDKVGALRREKAALMQQLLTGKRRLKTAESEAA